MDPRFPWAMLTQLTDDYLSRYGKLSQNAIDVRLSTLIEQHNSIDIAIAACAHAMSPTAVRGFFNNEVRVAPVTYYGIDIFLQALIAANHQNAESVSKFEAQCARRLLPFAPKWPGAGGRCLEGICNLNKTFSLPKMHLAKEFVILTVRACTDFQLELEGYRDRRQWFTVYSSVAWLSTLDYSPQPVSASFRASTQRPLNDNFQSWRT